jgi:hypothetical protein
MKTPNKLLMSLLVLTSLIFLELPVTVHAAVMEDYCIIPPYVKRDVSVNIMILFDNSEDMLGPAYTDTDYCPSSAHTNCYDSANGKYDKKYIGHFPPDACYTPPGSKFRYAGHNVNYTTYFDTGCPPGEFNGNILNWATMSRYTIAKKVLTGEASTAINEPFQIEGKESSWVTAFSHNYKDARGCRFTITSSPANVLSLAVVDPGASGQCKYPEGGPWVVAIDPTPGIEERRGLLQEFTDTNPADMNFDRGSPRFGVTTFTQQPVWQVTINQTIPPGNYEPFINTVKTMLTRAGNDLATAHYTDINYFASPSSTSVDPYKGCAVWESPPCVQGAAVPCRKSFILMLTTGGDVTGTTVASLPTECSATETRPLVRNACYAYNSDLRSDLNGRQNISTYVVQTFGTGTTNCATATGNVKALCDAANQGGGNYYSAGNDNLVDVIRQALQDIIKRSAAGTAASVLASGEGSGANLIQAVFYPRKKFFNSSTGTYDEIAWMGRLTNLWFYVDPYFMNSNIREDTYRDNILDLSNDYITQLYFDSTAELTKAMRWQDTDGDGDADGSQLSPDIEFEKIGSLWEAGLELWKRDISSSPRKIYTTINGVPPLSTPTDFSTANAGTLQSYLQADPNEAQAIIRYIHGEDNPVVSGTTYSYRSRTVAVDLNGDGDTLDAGEGAKVWKLGDVLNSTPKISSWIQLNNYDKIYGDGTYREYLNSSGYTGRGMIFAGANDGMLHAFYLGKLELSGTWKDAATKKARLSDSLSIGLGKELWAFIPKNVLPYLKYTTDPDYCHVYTVDLTPFIFDASINGNPFAPKTESSWRTILIGGMRFGGACRNAGSACTNCVKTPVANLGYSSYFALDITDTLAHQDDPAGHPPQFLWEFSSENLGFATTGPVVVRIGDRNQNGKWYVVFGSGPTGPTTGSGSTDYQFLGRSDQNLKLFILDLNGPPSGTWTLGLDYWVKDTGISNAFAGSLLNSTNDTDLDYQDDAVYVPYVKQDPSAGTWTQGGVGRLLTGENPDPSNWQWSKVIDNIGPVTSAVARLQHKSKGQLWLFFGTGRYYFELLSSVDDQDGQRQLFGIKDSCFSSCGFAPSCPEPTSCPGPISGTTGLTNVDDIADADAITNPDDPGFKGWYINLDASAGGYRAERVITDPIASLTGIVFFTTYKPYNDVCALGGKSFIWAVNYKTGGASGASLKGIALLQVSTGSIEQINLSTALTEKGGRRTAAMEGVPPTAQGLSLLSQPPPVKRTIHIKER